MQYHIQTLVKHLFDKDSFEQVTVDELKKFTDEYPYAAVGQFLYAKKLKDSGSYNNYEQSEQASLYFHNSLWLRWQLEQKEEAPALPAKAEEPAQQPGFRIVVQMPKGGAPIVGPAIQPEEKKEEETIQTPETPVEEVMAEQPAQPVAEATTAPVEEETVTEEQEKSLQVNEDGSLVEHQAATETATNEETPATAPEETASAVAIAEGSLLAEESSATEAAPNAVSITEEVLIAGPSDNTAPANGPVADAQVPEADEIVPAVEVTSVEIADAPVSDDIIPAVEIPQEDLGNLPVTDDIVPAIEVTSAELASAPVEDDIVPAVEIPREDLENEPVADDIVPAVEVTPQQLAALETPEVIETPEVTIPAEIAIEEERVEETTELIPAEEPVTMEEEPVAVAETTHQATAQTNHFGFTTATKEEKTAVDLGEPIFESYHTIDYFASQGIKLIQEELKDKLGKQLKSFTDWLRSMKRIGPLETNTSLDDVTNQSIQRIAEHSVEEKEIVTEAMAEVWAKQGNREKAIRVYEKLSLQNPAKSTYFASRIDQLKA